ncbi:TetR/AcrR family transcriptional regulator [Candidatus Formimonas warabiya]|uniref:HTH tetR-type domain-containing protein n=1 Tax=Formimonas warabiya TaxID=1761012 RepID=A0A3G1KYT3_FORW1|nr:TetR family transcriptional regulator [Candidatus Formimonas warabiya]ATW27666.1 hypothetical protein DCMF_25520 [Candidatus Formimonas warabiya]
MTKEILHEKSAAQHIMDTAGPLFAIRGYTGVSVKELAKAAGVNNALISYYFGGKKELYAKILSTQLEVLESVISEIKQGNLSPIKEIHFFAERIIIMHKRYPYLIRLVMSEIINPTDCYESIVKKEIEKMNFFLRTCIQRGIDGGDFKPDIDPAVVAINLVGMIDFYFMAGPLSQELLTRKDNQVEGYIKQSIDNYLQGIMSTK